MPLDEYHQRLFEQIEAGLVAEDPKFAGRLQRLEGRVPNARRRKWLRKALFALMMALLTVVTALVVAMSVLMLLHFRPVTQPYVPSRLGPQIGFQRGG